MTARRFRGAFVLSVALSFFAATPLAAQTAAGDLAGLEVAALGVQGNSAVTTAASVRSTVDMPDDLSGPQVHQGLLEPTLER